MAANMKEAIANATETLLFKRKIKKLTVKEIVQECNITRQTFYYHFADIPELLKWMMEKDSEKLLEECLEEDNAESGLLHLFSVAVNVLPYIKTGMQTKYGEEIENLLDAFIYNFFNLAIGRTGVYRHYSEEEKNFLIQYHCIAIKGLLDRWTENDTENIHFIVHQVYLLLSGQIAP